MRMVEVSFLNHSKICCFQMKIVVFTPKSSLIDPPLHHFFKGKGLKAFAQHTHTSFLTVSYDKKNKCS